MNQFRAALQRAVNRLLNSRAPEERNEAALAVTEALQAFLDSGELVNAEPDVAGLAEKTREQLGQVIGPASELADVELRELNHLLPWAAMTVDVHGRIIGAPWSSAKRSVVHPIMESRQIAFDRVFPLAGKHVAEFGCFEGIHTLGLLLLGASVTAVDGRMENVLKTMARVWAYGRQCQTLCWNFEQDPPSVLPAQWDVLHHIGVLYHLSNPVEHLEQILPRTREALILDTHVALDEEEARESYVVGGRAFRYRGKREPHADSSPFAGMRDHAKYLLVDELAEWIRSCGFKDTRVVDDRVERNGRRVTIWAFR